MTRTPFTCDGNHAALSQLELYSHHTRACRDDLTREARNVYQRANRAAKAERALAADLPAAAPAAYVDHFAAATAPPEAPAVPKPAPPTMTVTVSSLGTARRLRALAWLGYTPKDLAHESGLTADSVWWLLIAPPTRIQYRTAELVDGVFKRLRVQVRSQDVTTLEGAAANRARAIAELHNWAGPYDWEDIDFAADRPRTTRGHRDPASLTKAIEEAKLDNLTIPTLAAYDPAEVIKLRAITGQAEHDRDEAIKARDEAVQALAEATTRPARGDDLDNQLRHAQILLDEARAALEYEKSEHAEVTDTLTTRTAEFNAEYKTYTARTTAALAAVKRLEEELALRPSAGTLEFFDLDTEDTALAFTPAFNAVVDSMQIVINPIPEGGIRLTFPSQLLAR